MSTGTLYAINHILLVDDDEVTNFLNKKVIEKASLIKEISIATNGQKALEVIEELCESKKYCPELIFLDLNMPVMNGFEFLDKFEKMHFPNKDKVRIIVLTSSSNPDDIYKIKEKRIAFMTKPLSEDKIQSIVQGKV
jgi:CheY-like chemotaxis protein